MNKNHDNFIARKQAESKQTHHKHDNVISRNQGNNKHGIKITRQQMNELKRKQQPMKKLQPFVKGSNVFVVDRFDPDGEMIEATVLSYDPEIDCYVVEQYNGFVKIVKAKNVKGWWQH